MDVPQQFQVDLGKISVLDANNPQGAIVAGVQPTDKGFEINLGGFTPGSNAFIAFAMNLRDPGQLDCGENTFALRAAFVDSEQNRTDKSNEVRVIYTPGPCRPRNS
jgi:hypothetical protein